MAITIYDTLEQGNVGGKLVKGNDVWVNIDGTEKDLNSAIEDGDIGGGGDAEADNYIGGTWADVTIRVDTDSRSVAEGKQGKSTYITAKALFGSKYLVVDDPTLFQVGDVIRYRIPDSSNIGYHDDTNEVSNIDHEQSRLYLVNALSDNLGSGTEINVITGAFGEASHAEGSYTKTLGNSSHAEGGGTKANGDNSHAEGSYTVTSNEAEHAEGAYNISHTHDSLKSHITVHSVGIGTSINDRKNAHEVMQNGDHYFGDGKLYLGEFGKSKGRLDAAEDTLSVSLNGTIVRRIVEDVSDAFIYSPNHDISGIASSVTYAYRFFLMDIGGATEVVPKYENSFIGREVTVNGITYIVPIEGSRKDVSCDLSPYIKGSDDAFYYVIPGTAISSATVSLGILSSIPVLLNNLLPKVAVAYKDRWVTYTYYTGDDNLRIYVPSDHNYIYDFRQKTGGTVTINMSNAGRNYKETVIYLNDAYGYSIEGDDYIEVNEPPSDENSGVIISIQNNIIVYGEIPAQE